MRFLVGSSEVAAAVLQLVPCLRVVYNMTRYSRQPVRLHQRRQARSHFSLESVVVGVLGLAVESFSSRRCLVLAEIHGGYMEEAPFHLAFLTRPRMSFVVPQPHHPLLALLQMKPMYMLPSQV